MFVNKYTDDNCLRVTACWKKEINIRWLVRSDRPMMLLIDHTCSKEFNNSLLERKNLCSSPFSEVQSMINISISLLLYLIFWLLKSWYDLLLLRKSIWLKWEFVLGVTLKWLRRGDDMLHIRSFPSFPAPPITLPTTKYYHSTVKCDDICIYTQCVQWACTNSISRKQHVQFNCLSKSQLV